ncbi:hypothetical protein K1T71_005168 [Dendrolimus kikuchii]|uniref:Uncharacterized protein n=1 Tax=Dendrolimus kikuchii TaxID=765133 RepID=A0ACC1D6F1_9NEOP|nr:hypothetical protein K1T71_005168 [Dendrolimus kikuchii]
MILKNKKNVKATRIQEYLSEDIIDPTFITSFSYLLRVQMVLGSCRVHVKDRFVTPPTKWQKLYTILLILITILLDYTTISCYFSQYFFHSHLYFMGLLSMGLDFAFSVTSTIHIRFLNGEANVKLYIRLQHTDRLMKLEKCSLLNQMLFGLNVLSGVVLKIVYALLTGLILVKFDILSQFSFLGMTYVNILLLLEIVYCSNIAMYFVIRLKLINAILKNHVYPESAIVYPIKYTFLTEKVYRCYAAQYHDYNSSDVYIYLKELFDIFFMFQELYKFQVNYN